MTDLLQVPYHDRTTKRKTERTFCSVSNSAAIYDAARINADRNRISDEGGIKKRKIHRISRFIKAVILETSLLKRIRIRKLRKQPSRWEIREPSETTADEGSSDWQLTASENERSEVYSHTKSTRTICLLSENEEDSGDQHKHEDSLNLGSCFFPASLLVLILWGKVCAIFCTSTWLLFVTPRMKDREVPPGEKCRGLHLKHYLRGL